MKRSELASLPDRLTSTFYDRAVRLALALGYTDTMVGEAQRDTLWWLWARIQAAASARGLLEGRAVTWGAAGYADLVPFEVPRPGRRKITVLVHSSPVSPGTERAQYLHLPNAAIGIMARPGYSCSGVVTAVGPGVDTFAPGDRVAVAGAQHASVVTVPADSAYRIPDGVSLESAALVQLGVIAGQGMRRGRVGAGTRFCVVGAGLVGILAQRLAGAAGAECAAVIATSRSKEEAAGAGGLERFLVAGEDDEAIAELAAPVVVEATGDPEAIMPAVAATAAGGCVVLLGSARGAVSDLPLEAIREKRLTLVGAHVQTLDMEAERAGVDTHKREAEYFLTALADGRLEVDDLLGLRVDPREVGLFYQELTRDRGFVGALLDWTQLPEPERARPGRIWRLPDAIGRGMDVERRPLPAGGSRHRRTRLLELGDPFAGACGLLRIGLLGCGDIATHNAAAIAAAPNAELAASYDPVERLAGDLARRFGGEVAPSAEALLERSDVDAVFLAVPHDLHAPLAIAAADAGKHIVVEKPQANDLAAALAMTEAAERAGVVLSVAFPQRYEPAVELVRRLVDAGALGGLTGAAVKLLLDKTPAYWLGGFSGRSPSTWRRSRERAGGGVLIMNLCHYVDLLRYLGSTEIESVSALADAIDEPSEVEDTISISVRFANGAVGSIVGCSAVRATVSRELRLWGRDGHVAVEPRPRVFTLRPLDGLRTGRWQTLGRLPATPIRAIFVSRLATALAERREPDVTAADGLAVQAFVEAAYRSSELGEPVRPGDLLEGVRA